MTKQPLYHECELSKHTNPQTFNDRILLYWWLGWSRLTFHPSIQPPIFPSIRPSISRGRVAEQTMLMGEPTQTREDHGCSPQYQWVLKNNKSITELIKSVMSFSYFPFLHSSFIIFTTKLLCIIQAKEALSNHTRDKSHIFHQFNGCFYLSEKGNIKCNCTFKRTSGSSILLLSWRWTFICKNGYFFGSQQPGSSNILELPQPELRELQLEFTIIMVTYWEQDWDGFPPVVLGVNEDTITMPSTLHSPVSAWWRKVGVLNNTQRKSLESLASHTSSKKKKI